MSDSIFNPEALLDTTYEESPPDHYTPIDEGEYPLKIKNINVRRQTTNDGRAFHVADVDFIVEDEGVKAKLNMPEPSARMSIFLDLNEQGQLDMGTNKNVKVGALKKAVGLKEGRKWSFRHMIDCTCYGKIKQEADRNDPERIYSRVVTVTREPTAQNQGQRAA